MFCPDGANGLEQIIEPSDVEHLCLFPQLEFSVITVENRAWFKLAFVTHVAYTTTYTRLLL